METIALARLYWPPIGRARYHDLHFTDEETEAQMG